jgi:hypothetical protein
MCPLTRQLTGTQFSRAGADEKAAYAGRVLIYQDGKFTKVDKTAAALLSYVLRELHRHVEALAALSAEFDGLGGVSKISGYSIYGRADRALGRSASVQSERYIVSILGRRCQEGGAILQLNCRIVRIGLVDKRRRELVLPNVRKVRDMRK